MVGQIPINAKYSTSTVTSASITNGAILNADINASAAIALSKLAAITAGYIVVGSAATVPTAVAVSGDITLSDAGVVAIATGVIVNADVNASAAIALSKLAAVTAGYVVLGNGSNVATATAVSGAITINSSGVTTLSEPFAHTTDGVGRVEKMAVGSYDFANAGTLALASATDIANATDTFTSTSHGLVDGDLVNVTTDNALPTGLAVNTGYYVRYVTDDTFKLYDTRAHALATPATTGLISISDDGTGTQTFLYKAGIGYHPLGITMPDNAIITGGMIDVITGFADEDDDSATLAFQAQGANDLVTATAISSGTSWDAGIKDIIPDATGSTAVKMTAAKEVFMLVADDQLTAGKLMIYIRYVQGV